MDQGALPAMLDGAQAARRAASQDRPVKEVLAWMRQPAPLICCIREGGNQPGHGEGTLAL